jgi:hypothetical protein
MFDLVLQAGCLCLSITVLGGVALFVLAIVIEFFTPEKP